MKTFLLELRAKAAKMKNEIIAKDSDENLEGFLETLFAEGGWDHKACTIPEELAFFELVPD